MHIFKRNRPDNGHMGWREYQAQIKKKAPRRPRRFWFVTVSIAAVVGGLVYFGLSPSAATPERPDVYRNNSTTVPSMISKKDAQVLLSQLTHRQLTQKMTPLPFKGQHLVAETSLDMELQSYLIDSMDLKNSRYIGIVVMDVDTGRILVMAGFDKTDPGANPCLQNSFPAASLFKIVTAAAAVDICHYNAYTKLRFNGYKHTLYKSQLKDYTNKYTNTMQFKDAFAQSVNPVFGKIGSLRLGKSNLEKFAHTFGFNQPINFELVVAPSKIRITEDPYHWAEIASGFNNDTTISPLHGAMMAAAVINKGKMKGPTIIDRISDADGRLIYEATPVSNNQAMSPQAAETLIRMMMTTVASGTARKVFKGMRRHPTLSHLEIGGKTGSIFNRSHDIRFDWFVGFARDKKGHGRLAVSAVVGHEEYIGKRAGQYARMAMTRFFESQLAQKSKSNPNAGS